MKGVAKENPFISIAVHDRKVDRQNGYPVPYRCLYSKNIENLFMAGRNISVDRRALGTTRVMRTCGMMGEVVGKAAWIATTRETSPRGVYLNYLPALIDLMEQPGRARRASLNDALTIPPIPEGGLRTNSKEDGGLKLKGIVIDDAKAKLTGKWSSGNNLKPHYGPSYRYATAPASAKFPIRVKESGTYEVRFYWKNHENRNTATQLTVTDTKGKKVITLNQTKAPESETYTSLGSFEFSDVLPASLEVSGEGSGFIAIDAIQLLKSE